MGLKGDENGQNMHISCMMQSLENSNKENRTEYKTKCIRLYSSIHINYTVCPRRNVPDFGRVYLMLKYTDITQNTYIQS